jgi:predicted nucleic acid-binding protein
VRERLRDFCTATVAPDFFSIETVNVLWKYYRAGEIEYEAVFRLQMKIGELPNSFVPTEELVVEALQDSLRLNYPLYDTLYLVLARRSNAVLLTLYKVFLLYHFTPRSLYSFSSCKIDSRFTCVKKLAKSPILRSPLYCNIFLIRTIRFVGNGWRKQSGIYERLQYVSTKILSIF